MRNLYLDLLKHCLTMTLWDAQDGFLSEPATGTLKAQVRQRLKSWLTGRSGAAFTASANRQTGRDWPRLAHTMIGVTRMNNLQFCVEDVLKHNVPGDLIETGVWRGGACIFMRGILRAYGVQDRRVWVADSFAGLPRPDPIKYPADAGDLHHTLRLLAISLLEVKANFSRYGLLDDQVCFLAGWFKETLPGAPFERLAVVRLDGDMYESTLDGLTHLYPKLAVGGYLIVDDYGVLPGCRKAVDDYRQAQRIREPIQPIDGWGVFWQRAR